MDLEEKQIAEKALRHLFIGSKLDGIKFGLSPATTFVYFTHYSNHEPDQLWLHIETKWGVYPPHTKVFPNSEEEMDDLTEEEQFRLLFELRREVMSDIRIGDISPHLLITFHSGKLLFINGYHPKYECWQAGDGQGYTGDEWLIVALPNNGISICSPQD